MYTLIRKGRFPTPMKLSNENGTLRNRWAESEVRRWMAEPFATDRTAFPIDTGNHRKPMGPNDLLTDVEVADLLKINRKTLTNWRCLGKGPKFVRVGERMVRYRRSDIAAFLSEGTDAELTQTHAR